jgi:hypothetical protein
MFQEASYKSQENQQDKLFLFNHILKAKQMKILKFPILVENLIVNDNPELLAIYEVYNMTGDRMDFAENVRLIYKKAFGAILKEVIQR